MKTYKIKIPLQLYSVSEVVFPKIDSSDNKPQYEEAHVEDVNLSIMITGKDASEALGKFVKQFTSALKVGKELG